MIIDRFIQELELNKEIQNVSIEKNAPINKIAEDILLEDISYLSQEFELNFFKNSDGLKIDWKRNAESILDAGECNVQGGLDVFFSSGKNIYWDDGDNSENEYDKFCRRLILLDKYERAYDSTRNIAVEINEQESKSKKLWYWNDEGDKYPLKLDLSNYFSNLLKTKAIINWQLFFIDFEFIYSKNNTYRNFFYGTTHMDTLEEMKLVLEVSKLFEKELFLFLSNKYDQTVKEFKKF